MSKDDIPASVVSSIELHCTGTIYSFMLFPVIPLPPFIPSYGINGNGKAWFTFRKDHIEKHELNRVEIADFKGKVIFKSSIYHTYDSVDSMSLPYKCKDLDGHFLTLLARNGQKYVASLKYIRDDVQFSWGYLSQ